MKFFIRILIMMTFFAFIESAMAQEDVLRPYGKPNNSKDNPYHKKSRQSPWKIGIEAGLNYNMLTQNLNWEPGFSYLGEPYTFYHGTVFNGIDNASGVAPHFGILADYSINETFGLQFRVSYDVKDVSVSTSGTDIDTYGRPHDMNLDVDSKLAYITLNPLLRINAGKSWFFTLGPVFHFLSGDIETTWKPSTKDGFSLGNFGFWNMIYSSSSQSSVSYTGSSASMKIKETNSISPRVGLELGTGYKIPLSNKIELVPQLRYQLMFSKIQDDSQINYYPDLVNYPDVHYLFETTTDKTINTLQFTIALWFGL